MAKTSTPRLSVVRTGDREPARSSVSASEPTAGCNEVRLVGRLAAPPESRSLPSGDELVLWRLVVPRAARAPDRPRSPTVDTIACQAWLPSIRRRAVQWRPGEIIELHGALRRRFWQSPNGPASQYEVEVSKARVLRRAGRSAKADGVSTTVGGPPP